MNKENTGTLNTDALTGGEYVDVDYTDVVDTDAIKTKDVKITKSGLKKMIQREEDKKNMVKCYKCGATNKTLHKSGEYYVCADCKGSK